VSDSNFSVFVIAGVVWVIGWWIGTAKADQKIASDRREFDAKNKLREDAQDLLDKSISAKARLADEKIKRFELLRFELQKGYIDGRNWLAEMISQAELDSDRGLENYLRYKKRPAHSAADNVRVIAAEKRQWMTVAKKLEFELAQLSEYFPPIAEYRTAIAEEIVNATLLEDSQSPIDPVLSFITAEEWKNLPVLKREELALERYITGRAKNAADAGRRYERYLGYRYESQGWNVTYEGAIKGFDDYGRDLICIKNNVIHVVQAKRWNIDKRILHMKHVVQLFGTTKLLQIERNFEKSPKAILISTAEFAEDALLVAKALGVTLETVKFEQRYPLIKVHIGRNGEPLYHLPFDQQYDRVQLKKDDGDRYVMNIHEALGLGARRAMRYGGK
jgi:Restriction endonuclease